MGRTASFFFREASGALGRSRPYLHGLTDRQRADSRQAADSRPWEDMSRTSDAAERRQPEDHSMLTKRKKSLFYKVTDQTRIMPQTTLRVDGAADSLRSGL